MSHRLALRSLLVAVSLVHFLGCHREPPPAAPPEPALVAPGESEQTPDVVRFDLTDPEESARWRLRSGIAGSEASSAGLSIRVEGNDPFVSRIASLPDGGIDQIEIETDPPVALPFRVYLRVGGAEREKWAIDSAPLAVGSPIQVADYRSLPAPPEAISEIRLDPPSDVGQFTLVGVRVRPRSRAGLINIGGEARWCRRSATVTMGARNLARDRIRVSLGLQPVGGAKEAPLGTLVVRLDEPGGAEVHQSRHRVALETGWTERIVDFDVPGPPRDLALSLALVDSAGAPVDACFETPRLLERRLSAATRPNVLLVSIDTLRADHLEHAPFLQRLAREGRSLPNTWAASNFTLASHAALLTGASPVSLDTPAAGLEAPFVGTRIPERFATLAEALRDAGWATAATTDGGMLAPVYGFARGFERYHIPPPGVDAERAHADFAREIAAGALGERPFFLFAHTYVAHDYYLNTPRYHDEVDPEGDAALIGRGSIIEDIRNSIAPADYARRLYVAGVRRADELLEALVDGVRVASRDAPLLVVVTSDHGESFGDLPGIWHHGTSLADEQLRVPLVIWSNGPGAPRGRSDAPTSGIDVMPSLLHRLGVAVPASCAGAQDRFLDAPALQRAEPILSLQSYASRIHYSAIDGRFKYLRSDSFDGATVAEDCRSLLGEPAQGGELPEAAPEECRALRLDLARNLASDVPRALVVRSNAPVELDWVLPHPLVAVRPAMPAAAPIARLTEGIVAWTPQSPEDALAIVVHGRPGSLSHLALAGIDTGRSGDVLPVLAESGPLRAEVRGAGASTASVEIGARALEASGADWMPEAAVVERLRALGYLPGAGGASH